MSQTADNLLEAIPPPPVIRRRLAQLMREQDLLRSLLRVSERKQREAATPALPCHEDINRAS
jgi:hypothetical protein